MSGLNDQNEKEIRCDWFHFQESQ